MATATFHLRFPDFPHGCKGVDCIPCARKRRDMMAELGFHVIVPRSPEWFDRLSASEQAEVKRGAFRGLLAAMAEADGERHLKVVK